MRLQILDGGPLTTVQDLGRYGYQGAGVTTSGAMDQAAYREANLAAGNPAGNAALELTLKGPVIRIEGEGMIAFAGADMPAKLDDTALERGRGYPVRDGQILSFGMAESGVRTYLAVSGGIDVPVVLGSRSTNLKCHLGGYYGRKLQAGDILECFPAGKPEGTGVKRRGRSAKVQPVYGDTCEVRAVPGPQADAFTKEAGENFFTGEYMVTPESDRMGIRLTGPALAGKDGTDIVSDGITFGSVQVTSGGQPIVLMADHQTAGGYAKIATVVSEDLWMLAQARPGTKVRFRRVTVEQMQKKHGLFRFLKSTR